MSAPSCNHDLCRWLGGLSKLAVELQREILRHLLRVVSEHTCQDLRLSREVRKLWDKPNALDLTGQQEVLEFCNAVQAFQVGILATHPNIYFANITALQMRVHEEEGFVANVRTAFRSLRIRDLCLLCGCSPRFMDKAVHEWATSLQHLSKLRIKFDCRTGEEHDDVYPWLQDSWSSAIARLPGLSMLWLDTPLALSEDFERTFSNESADAYAKLPDWLEDIAQKWTSGNASVKRIYLFFGYDDDLNLGDGMICVGYRYRLMKLPSGKWESVNIAAWAENGDHDGDALFERLYHPFDGLPGILPDDLEYFPDI